MELFIKRGKGFKDLYDMARSKDNATKNFPSIVISTVLATMYIQRKHIIL